MVAIDALYISYQLFRGIGMRHLRQFGIQYLAVRVYDPCRRTRAAGFGCSIP